MPTTTTSTKANRPSADETRERILTAALDLFSERSFEGATTREIAARAGVTQPLLNYHFSSKDELWKASVDALFESLTAALGAREAGLRGVDDLTVVRLLTREFIEFSARHPQLHRLVMQECKGDGPRVDWLVDTHIRPFYETVTARFARLIDGGALPQLLPAHLWYILIGAGTNIFVLAPECRRLAGFDPLADDVVTAHADAVVALLFGAPDAPGPVPRRRRQRATRQDPERTQRAK